MLLEFSEVITVSNVNGDTFDYRSSLGSKSPYKNACPECSPLQECTLVQVQLLNRHGARYWSASKHAHFFDLVDYIVANTEPGHRLENFSIPYPKEGASLLAPIGVSNMHKAGKRFRAKYEGSGLFGDISKITIYSSETERVIDSASSFLNGSFEDTSSLDVKVAEKQTDADLNPIHSCQKYKDMDFNLQSQEQVKQWTSTFVDEVSERYSRELGILISNEQAILIMELCASLVSLLNFNRTEGLCYLLEDRDFENYEMRDDLEKYHLLGYAQEFNSKLACSLVTSMFNDAQNTSLNLALRFGHAETLLPLFVALGLYYDENLTAKTPSDILKSRSFKTGNFLTFASNVVLESYDCSTAGKRIRILVNEMPVDIPGCDSSGGICSWERFRVVMEKAGYGCDFNAICENPLL